VTKNSMSGSCGKAISPKTEMEVIIL